MVTRAEAAVARAQQEQVATHAPVPLRNAQEKLDKAKEAMREARNVEASRLAEQSLADAEVAIATADRARTEEAVTELSRTIDALKREVQR